MIPGTIDGQYNGLTIGDGIQQQQQPTQIVFVPLTTSKVAEKYPQLQSKILGTTQIIIGILLIIFNSVALIYRESGPSIIGSGIWCGIMFIITGSFGISAGISRNKCKIVTFMVLCIISAALTSIIFIFGLISALISTESRQWRCYHPGPSYGDNNGYSAILDIDCMYRHNVHLAMGVCVAVFAVFETIAATWASAICCKVLCCSAEPVTGVLYQSNANSQATIIGHQVQSGQIHYVSPGPPGQAFVPSQQYEMPPFQYVQPGLPQSIHSSDSTFGRGSGPPGYSRMSSDDAMDKPLIP